jgi:histidinol phosphatase-like enzyme (inositol monophosphatase family)
MSFSTYMEAALDLARLTGNVALDYFRKPLAVDQKPDGSPVTRADRKAETAALAWLHERWPNDGVLSEEFGLARAPAPRRWIIDPIDGTKTFLRGVPLWGTLVAVIEANQIIAGAAYFPALGETIAAAPGLGAWHNGVRARVSDVCKLAHATVVTTDANFPVHHERLGPWSALSRDVALSRTWGDCYGYLLVATGRAEAMVDDAVNFWDTAAILPILEEAGGVFTDWRGQRSPYGSDAIATNAALATLIRNRLGARITP